MHRPGTDGDVSVLSALALFNAQDTALKVQIRQVELAKFVSSNAGGIKDFQYRPVTQAEWLGDIGNSQDTFHFGGGQDRLGQAMFCPRHFKLGGRVEGNDALPGEPGHEACHRREPLPLRAVGEWTTALLAVMKQVSLVIQNDLAGDGDGLEDAGLLASLAEMAKLLVLAEDGLRAVVANGQVFEVTRN